MTASGNLDAPGATRLYPAGAIAQPTDIVPSWGIRSHPKKQKCPRRDSNAQPTDSKSGTLSIELRGLVDEEKFLF